MKLIPLKNREGEIIDHAMVDDDIFDEICDLAWHKKNGGYASHGIKAGKSILMHRMIYSMKHKTLPKMLDHIDRNRLNNQIANLRPTTARENGLNREVNVNNTSGFMGVIYRKHSDKYESRFMFNNELMSLGLFPLKREAAIARDLFALDKYGKDYLSLSCPDATESEIESVKSQFSTAKKRAGASRFIGVKQNGYKPSPKKWCAHLRKNGKLYTIVYLEKEEDAALARDYYAVHMFDSYDLNFPEATVDDYRRIRDVILSKKKVKTLPFQDKYV